MYWCFPFSFQPAKQMHFWTEEGIYFIFLSSMSVKPVPEDKFCSEWNRKLVAFLDGF